MLYDNLKGQDRGGAGGRLQKERIYMYLWLIRDVVQQNQHNFKEIILQLKIKRNCFRDLYKGGEIVIEKYIIISTLKKRYNCGLTEDKMREEFALVTCLCLKIWTVIISPIQKIIFLKEKIYFSIVIFVWSEFFFFWKVSQKWLTSIILKVGIFWIP